MSEKTAVLRGRGHTLPAMAGGCAILLVSALLASCGDGVTSPSELRGKWALQSMERVGSPVVVPSDPDRFTVDFAADGGIGVVADCNVCGGTYTLADDTLTVSGLACTLVACPGPPLGQQFVGLLEGTTTVDVDGNRLTIESTAGRLTFRR